MNVRYYADYFKWEKPFCTFGLYSILPVHQLLKREEYF